MSYFKSISNLIRERVIEPLHWNEFMYSFSKNGIDFFILWAFIMLFTFLMKVRNTKNV